MRDAAETLPKVPTNDLPAPCRTETDLLCAWYDSRPLPPCLSDKAPAC